VLRRVVGLAGDTVAMTGGVLRVNGRHAPWPARVVNPAAARTLDGPVRGTIYDWGPATVGADSVFVLSDSRDMFGWPDSRFVGAIPMSALAAGSVRILQRGASAGAARGQEPDRVAGGAGPRPHHRPRAP
jgi:hypothetical protein